MNGLAFVLVQTAAVEDKLNWVEVRQLYGMACVRLLWMSVDLTISSYLCGRTVQTSVSSVPLFGATSYAN